MYPVVTLALLTTLAALTQGQRITTIQLEGVQYFVSKMNPYSPELNWFLAYQYCRSIGLQLASFETKEKADFFMEYLRNAGYSKFDFWTSGNRLGTDMFLWMSTGLPFNVTFNYMKGEQESDPLSMSLTHGPQPITRKKRGDSGASNGCVALKKPDLQWETDDCTALKDFICEQTRCYYYNYGSIPVSTAQGRSQKMHLKSSVPPSSSSSPQSPPTTASQATATTTYSLATRKSSSPLETPRREPTTPRREPTTSAYRTEAYPTTTEDHAAKIHEDMPQVSENVAGLHEAESHFPKVHEESQDYVTTSDTSEDYNTHPDQEQTTAVVQEETNELQPPRNSIIGGSRRVPHDIIDSFQWPWARNIMLEKPVARKTSSSSSADE